MIERFFNVSASESTVRTEMLAGLTTFVTMAYIIFVPPTVVALAGILVAAILVARRVRGALLGGMLASAASGLVAGVIRFQGVVSAPPSIAPTFMKLDVAGVFQPAMIPVVFVFFFLALFDSVGTLVGVEGQAGLMQDGRLPRARGALPF